MVRTQWFAGVVIAAAGMTAAGVGPIAAQLPPPSILKEDCTKLRHKARLPCEARNHADADTTGITKPADRNSDMPTGADADAPGEPVTPRPATATTAPAAANAPAAAPGAAANTQKSQPATRPDTSDMPTGRDADPPASSMGPLRPDGTPDDAGPRGSSSSSSSSSSAASVPGADTSHDDEDAPPTTSGGDTPVKAAALKDLGSHADSSAARQKLEQSRVEDDVKVGRFYLRDGNLSGAETRFHDALEHDPTDPEANYAMAELLLRQKKNAEAAAQLQRYLQLAPDDDHSKDARKLLAKLGKQ